MGYPDGTKGYCLWDKDTGTFFIARDMIFNENLPSVTIQHSDSKDKDDSAHNALQPPTVALTPANAPSTSPPRPHRSSCVCVLTGAGEAFKEQMDATKVRLESLREAHTILPPPLTEGVIQPKINAPDNLENMEPNEDVPEALANLIVKEFSNVAIRSDQKRNPSDPNYDMGIPPASYNEAVLHPDRDLWLAAMKAELATMKEMKVYKLATLPEGRKAIGNRWVLEFKEDNKGGAYSQGSFGHSRVLSNPWGRLQCHFRAHRQNCFHSAHCRPRLSQQPGA